MDRDAASRLLDQLHAAQNAMYAGGGVQPVRALLSELAAAARSGHVRSGVGRSARVGLFRIGEQLTGAIMGVVMSYVLVPINDGQHTRLLLKIVTGAGRLLAPMLSVGDLIMARRQLLNLAKLAEGTPTSRLLAPAPRR